MVSYSGSFPTIVYKQPTEPSIESGALWFNTIDNKMYYCDGLDYSLLSVNTDFITEIVGQNALNILDLTAQASLTAGTNAYFIRDTYKDANGYLNSIDTANTTAIFTTNYYDNRVITQDLTEHSNAEAWYLLMSTFDLSSNPSYIENIKFNAKVSSSNGKWESKIVITFEDDTTEEILGQGQNTSYQTITNTPTTTDKKTKTIDCYIKEIYSYTALIDDIIVNGVYDDKLIITNTQNLSFEPSFFMIIDNKDITRTGSLNYNISFDNGSNYQNANSFTTYEITDKGQQLILKQNLDKGLNSGMVKVYNYGVLIW